MKANKKKILQLFIAFFLSGLFLYLSYKKIGHIDFEQVKEYQINYIYVFIGVAFFNISVFIRAMLWSGILFPEFTLALSYKALFLGMASNLVLPFRIGEVVKIAVFRNGYYTKNNKKSSFYYKVGGNMGLERFTDLLLMFSSCIIALYLVQFNQTIQARIKFFRNMTLTGILVIIILLVIIKHSKIYTKITWNWFDKLLNLSKEIKGKLVAQKFCKVGFVLIFAWVSVYLSIFFSLLGLDIDLAICKTASFIILIMTNLAVMFPSAPGGLGLFEYACIYSLGMFGITGVTAALAALIIHLVQYAAIIPIALAIIIIYKDKAIIKDIKLSRYKNEE